MIKWGHMDEIYSQMVSLQKEEIRIQRHREEGQCEVIGEILWAVERGFRGNQLWQHLDLGLQSSQVEKINFCCFSHPTYAMC